MAFSRTDRFVVSIVVDSSLVITGNVCKFIILEVNGLDTTL
jgi:hypothetical protein